MRACYVVHPTFWLKVAATLLSPFMSNEISDKLRYFTALADLLGVLDLQQLNIPDPVFEYVFTHPLRILYSCLVCSPLIRYDAKANGTIWNKSSAKKSEDDL